MRHPSKQKIEVKGVKSSNFNAPVSQPQEKAFTNPISQSPKQSFGMHSKQ